MSSAGGDALTAREQRRLEREERKRTRAAQESAKISTEKKTPGKEDKRGNVKDFSSSNGSASRNPPSGSKQTTSYEKVNIIEKTAKFDSVDKEKKRNQKTETKQKTEAPAKSDSSSTGRKIGSKFFDNLSKFESQANQSEKVKTNPFVRAYSSHCRPSSTSAAAEPLFRRSYRTSRPTPAIDDPSVHARRSLRKERVLESIAKLERKSSTEDGTTLKKKPPSLAVEKPQEKSKSSSRPSSGSSSKASLSDSGSSTSSTKGLTRAQQALERHKERMQKSTQSSQNGLGSSTNKPTIPNGKTRLNDCRKTPGKSKSRSKDKESPESPAREEQKPRKISVTTTPVDGDVVEVTTVTEVITPSDGKMNIVVKEIAVSEEESEKFLSPTEDIEYELGDPRPVSVEDTAAKFSEEQKPRKISVTTTPADGDIVEVTTVTEVMTPADGKMNIVVKEIAVSEEECEKILSTTEDIEYELGDPRPVSVEDTAAKFSEPKPPVTPSELTEKEKPRRRRKLPEIPTEQTSELTKSRRRSSKKDEQSQEGSGELVLTLKEQEVVVIETSPTFQQTSEVTKADSPPSGQNLQFLFNYNENSNSEKKSVNHNQAAFMREGELDHEREPLKHDESGRDPVIGSFNCDDITVELDTVRHQVDIDESPRRSLSPDEAIEVLRRLSEEIHSDPTVTKSSIVTSPAIQEENDNQDQSKPISENKSKHIGELSEKRPASLHIEEVLFISEETANRARSTSPQKRLVEEVVRTPSPRKFRKSSLKTFSKESSISEASRTPHPQNSPEKLAQKSSSDPPKTLFFEYPQEITSFEKQTRTPSPLKSSKPLSMTPESPTKSPIRVITPDSLQRSPMKTPTPASSPIQVEIPVKSSVTEPESFLITAEQVIESGVSAQENQSPSPIQDTTKSPSTRVCTPSPTKIAELPIEQSEHKPSLSETPEPRERSSSPPLKTPEPIAKTPSPARTPSPVKTSSKKMLATRRTFTPRYQKSWLDESDSDDNISLLSDAASDASSIDMDWLGKDLSDEDYHVPNKSSKSKSSSSGVQRTASSAQDMLKMWEKKVTEPKHGVRSTPTKLPSESVKRVGSMRAAWETKKDSPLHDSSYGSIDLSQERRNGNSQNGSESPGKISSTPSTPSRANNRAKFSPGDEKSSSGSDWKPRASESEEIMDIFDEKISGKIQGVKALFENLASSPKRSPSLRRSPLRRIDDKRFLNETAEDNVFPSRKSSFSQASESSDAAMPMDILDLTEDSPKVGNMRAMFENQANKKPEVEKHKPSLAEMVAKDDGDITDVHSIKAMWESMDNHR